MPPSERESWERLRPWEEKNSPHELMIAEPESAQSDLTRVAQLDWVRRASLIRAMRFCSESRKKVIHKS